VFADDKPPSEGTPASPAPTARTAAPLFASSSWLEAASTAELLPPFVRARAAWGAAEPVQPYVAHTPAAVTLHHTGALWTGRPPIEQYLRNIQAFHTGPRREWEDIAYHYLVDLDGTVWAGRPPTVRGNPSIYFDSRGQVLICLVGDYEVQEPSQVQIAAVGTTAAWLIRRFNMTAGAIGAHRDYAPTTCPGASVYRLLQEGAFAGRVG